MVPAFLPLEVTTLQSWEYLRLEGRRTFLLRRACRRLNSPFTLGFLQLMELFQEFFRAVGQSEVILDQFEV